MSSGRANDCQALPVKCPATGTPKAGHFFWIRIADRGSTNGVVLGGKKIAQETEMQNGDVAVLGLYELRLEHVDEKGIFVRKAEFPSTINQIIRGGGVERPGRVPQSQATKGTVAPPSSNLV